MGMFKGTVEDNIIIWLKQHGYKEGTGAQGELGYVHKYQLEDNDNLGDYVHVTINFDRQKIYLYKETCYESFVRSDIIDINESWLESVESFVDNIDKMIDNWIEGK